ncbi:MAG: ABC transporter permease [Lachnospiraceae bacterium]|nr:ABC transporter permease [Lachnospiraceae bacterium]
MKAERVKAENVKAVIQKYGVLIVLILLLLINACVTPNFVHINTIWNLLRQAFPTIIISMGMTLVIATGGIDISVGSTMALSSIIFARLLIDMEMGFGVSMLGALGASCVFGLFNGALVGILDFQPIVATLILMIAGRGIAQQFNNGAVLSFYGNAFTDLGTYRIGGVVPIQVLLIFIVVAIMSFLARKTTFGLYVQAIGDNGTASRLVGLKTTVVLIETYTLCALLAGGAAVLETLRLCAADPNNIGSGIELDCVAAVAIGGTSMSGGKAVIWGTLIGAIVMQLITTMMNMNNIYYAYALVIKAFIIIAALYLQRKKD